MEKEELKAVLEETARTTPLKVEGKLAELKTPEQKEAEEEFEEWKHKKYSKVVRSSQFELYSHFLRMVINKHITSLICVSKTGYGKTYITLNEIKKQNIEFVYKSGYITALSFYHFLYKNKDRLIILDDLTDDVFKDKKMIALLKACLYSIDEEDRFVSYETTSKALEVPNRFKFTGRIILLANEFRTKRASENLKALVSRTVFFRLKYSFEEILEISDKILLSLKLDKKLIQRVKDIIKNNICAVSEFNFRQLEQLVKMVQYNPQKAEELFQNSFKQDKDLLLVTRLTKLPLSVEQQGKIFQEKTGHSRRTYFRLKRRMKEEFNI